MVPASSTHVQNSANPDFCFGVLGVKPRQDLKHARDRYSTPELTSLLQWQSLKRESMWFEDVFALTNVLFTKV